MTKNVKVHKYNNSEPLSLMTVREINEFVGGGHQSLYATANENGVTYRIIRARTRTRQGVIQGRTLMDVGWINL